MPVASADTVTVPGVTPLEGLTLTHSHPCARVLSKLTPLLGPLLVTDNAFEPEVDPPIWNVNGSDVGLTANAVG